MKTTDLKIERIENPTLEYFEKHIRTARKPTIITGVVNNWQAYSLWTVDYLNSVVGDNVVKIAISQNSIFRGDPEHGYDAYKSQLIKFSEALHLIEQHRNSTDKYHYITQLSFPQYLPELLQDFDPPLYIENSLTDAYNPINLWLGSGGNTASLHYDNSDNLLSQVKGKKRVVFFSPDQTALLYPFPSNCLAPQYSYLNIDKPDLNKFPKFQQTQSCECILESGEMLFIPAFWWHHVNTLKTSESINIAINFWFKPPLITWFNTPPGRRHAVQIPSMLRAKTRKLHRKLTRKIKTTLKLN